MYIAHGREHPSKLRTTLLYMVDVQMSKAMTVKLFIWFSVYLRYNVIGVIYMHIYDKVFDMEL